MNYNHGCFGVQHDFHPGVEVMLNRVSLAGVGGNLLSGVKKML